MFDWVENRFLAKGLKYDSLSFPVYKLSRENIFLKRRKVVVLKNRLSAYAEPTVRRFL